MRLLSIAIFYLTSFCCVAQDSLITVSGFVDLYYAFDFNKPADRDRQYTTQPARHNELNLNWAYIKIDYANERIRSSFALQTGTFVEVNYAYEPEIIRNIYQASIGYQLAKKIWVDAGIMPSHIGMESAVSLDNWNYSRNIQSDFSPYYQAGIHLSADISEKVKAKFVLINGFQIVKENNEAKSVGLSINYFPNQRWEIGYSNYFGNEAPSDSLMINDAMQKLTAKHRFFNNIFLRGQLSDRINLALVGEYNTQEHFTNEKTNYWYNVLAIIRYSLSEQWSLAARGELFCDQHQIVATTGTPNGFQVQSYTLTLNYYPVNNLAVRAEARTYRSTDAIYSRNYLPPTTRNTFLTASIALKF